MADDRREAVRVLLLVQIPVTQRGVVVVATFEPAVVDDKALHAQRGRLVGHAHDVVRVVIKVDAFPGIEVDRARFVFGEADNVVAKVMVKLLAHAVQALRGVACIQARRPERVAHLNRHFARQVEGFSLQIAAAVGFGFRTQAVVAAPAQMHAPDVAVHFAE